MPGAALALVLFAALFHASYNFLAKSSRDTTIFLWWSVTLGAGMYGVILAISGLGFSLASASYPYYFLSEAAELGYFYGLVRGYEQGDLSLVYPLSRGSAPLFVALASAAVMGERLPLVGYFGIALMVGGVYIASLTGNGLPPEGAMRKTFAEVLLAPFRNHAARWALASAVFIAIYSLSDSQAIRHTEPLVYNFWVYFGNIFSWAIVVWLRDSRMQIMGELRANLKLVLVAAVLTLGAYALVLVAQTMTSTSYVVAGRGTSVVIGALLGTRALKEGFGKERLLSALLMVAGLVLIAVG